MANRDMLNDLEFENIITTMEDRQLLEFVARKQFEITGKIKTHDKKITNIEKGNRNASGITGAITGTIASVTIAVIDYFTRRTH